MKVLLIEPDVLLGKLYINALNKRNIKGIAAESADVAMQIIDEHKPSVIVLEPQIAGHSGFELLHELKSYEDLANLPIIIYSVLPEYLFGTDEVIWKNYGVSKYFYKPKVRFNTVINAIDTIAD